MSERTAQDTGNLYEDLSGYYDKFCAEVDYAEQCEFAERAFACFATSSGRDYLDLACGTGQHLLHMQRRGFSATGLDNSAHMLALAKERCPSAQLLLCDIAAFDQVAQFDLITCFLYSIHYSHPTAAMQETLRCAWHALKPGGVFLFNAVDVGGIRNDKRVITQLIDDDTHLRFESGWEYSGYGDVMDLFLLITKVSKSGSQSWRDHHTMTAVSLSQLRIMLEEIGFQVTLLEHDYGVMRPLAEGCFNTMVVASKPLR
ncbi:MAG: class I SAM-dependent methyltransferase [Gammaproteobacteria bacterium]|nr:class I SAM-dependent methyltransferase [Gammaproteobacteria bacterium]